MKTLSLIFLLINCLLVENGYSGVCTSRCLYSVECSSRCLHSGIPQTPPVSVKAYRDAIKHLLGKRLHGLPPKLLLSYLIDLDHVDSILKDCPPEDIETILELIHINKDWVVKSITSIEQANNVLGYLEKDSPDESTLLKRVNLLLKALVPLQAIPAARLLNELGKGREIHVHAVSSYLAYFVVAVDAPQFLNQSAAWSAAWDAAYHAAWYATGHAAWSAAWKAARDELLADVKPLMEQSLNILRKKHIEDPQIKAAFSKFLTLVWLIEKQRDYLTRAYRAAAMSLQANPLPENLEPICTIGACTWANDRFHEFDEIKDIKMVFSRDGWLLNPKIPRF